MYLFFCWLYYISRRTDKSRRGTHPRAALRSKNVLLLFCIGRGEFCIGIQNQSVIIR